MNSSAPHGTETGAAGDEIGCDEEIRKKGDANACERERRQRFRAFQDHARTLPQRAVSVFLVAKERGPDGRPYPTWTAVGVNRLAGFDFEVKVIARVPSA